MDGIELLVKEHEYILDFTRYLRKICCDILEGKEVDIAKEDEVCYSFALRKLTEEDRKKVNEETREFEDMARENHVQEKYTSWLTEQIKSNNS